MNGWLLAGQVRYAQPTHGYRSGFEPVLLAAAVPARPGERVLEAGTGAAAALLCLSRRVPDVHADGVEIDAALAELARRNAAANGFHHLRIITGAIETVPLAGPFDHAIANPPYHAPDGSMSPMPTRETAKRRAPGMIEAWIARCGKLLRYHASLTLIVPAGLAPHCLQAMDQAQCPCTVLFPLWPRRDHPAKLVLLRGIRQSRTPMRLAAGLVLHQEDGALTPAAQAILSGGEPLRLEG